MIEEPRKRTDRSNHLAMQPPPSLQIENLGQECKDAGFDALYMEHGTATGWRKDWVIVHLADSPSTQRRFTGGASLRRTASYLNLLGGQKAWLG
jgi:hypothetical protein